MIIMTFRVVAWVAVWMGFGLPGMLGTALVTGGPVEAGNSDFVLTADTPWILARGQPEPIERAINDLKRDWYRVFGYKPLVLDSPPGGELAGSVIYLGHVGGHEVTRARTDCAAPEGFVVRAQKDVQGRDALVVTGADIRGAIYAIYAFSEEILGIEPLHFFTDQVVRPQTVISIPSSYHFQKGSPAFRYRGWFMNDEDLLHGFARDPMDENPYSLEMLDRVCEALLRLRGNMIVPGTFVFPDERCQELASRRGLALNMHHIMPLGLNTRRWPQGMRFSHRTEPEIMERHWQTCIETLAQYEVVWTIGYRGRSSRPFWLDEPEINTPAMRGEVISRAIAKQVELVRRVQPDAPLITNLWAEGAALYHDGLVRIPSEVTVVWPDDGAGSMRDSGRVRPGDGMYYHTAMLSDRGNQWSELVSPERIHREIGRFARAGATRYFLLNVGDIRPVPLSSTCAMRLAWDASPAMEGREGEAAAAFVRHWCALQYGEAAADRTAGLYQRYFGTPYMNGAEAFGENRFFRSVHKLAAAVGAASKGGSRAGLDGEPETMLETARTNRNQLERLVRDVEAAEAIIPPERRDFYRSHLLTQARLHLGAVIMGEAFARAVSAWRNGDQTAAAESARRALSATEGINDDLRAADAGKWAGWHGGDLFVGIGAARDSIRTFIASVTGQTPPLARRRNNYEDLYQYQSSREGNYPLLHERKQ